MQVGVALNNSTADRRATLVASREKWSQVGERTTPGLSGHGRAGNYKQDSVQQWLMSSCQEQVNSDPDLDSSEPLKRQTSEEDDLMLGVEASLYGRNPVLTPAHEFQRSWLPVPGQNSVASAVSAHSGTLSVMDVLDLWHDDPEELLLELGFGSEEPDISDRIPSRFTDHQSQARGINVQVFLEAQKNRLDLENPDVSSRFRQLEVLHQVTSAFSTLVPAAPPPPPADKISPVSRERRKRLGMLLRRASKKSLNKNQGQRSPPADPSANQEPDLSDRRSARKHSRPGPPENAGLTPLVEEQSPSASRDTCEPPAGSPPLPGKSPRPQLGCDPPCVAPWSPLRRKSPGDTNSPESFEIEEIYSFDESASRSAAEVGEPVEARFLRTSSCQSDSSGFLEEPVIPCLSQQASPVPELMKALHNLSGESTDSQITVKESNDISYGMDSPTTVEEMADIPCTMDSLIPEEEMADIPDSMDSQLIVIESTDIPYRMDSPTTVKEMADIPCRMGSLTTVKEMADIPYRMDSLITEEEMPDIPNSMDSQLTVIESTGIPCRMDSPTTAKEMPDIPNSMDSQLTVIESTDIPCRMDSPTTAKEMTDIPYRMDSPTTVKESTNIPHRMDRLITEEEIGDTPYRTDSLSTVKESTHISNGIDSQLILKESADIPFITDEDEGCDVPNNTGNSITVKDSADIPPNCSLITVNKCADIPHSFGTTITVNAYADVPYSTDSPITLIDCADVPYNYSMIIVNDSADIPNVMDSPITVKKHADIPCTFIPVKESADIPYGAEDLMDASEVADLPFYADSLRFGKETSDPPYRAESLKEDSDIPFVSDSRCSLVENSDNGTGSEIMLTKSPAFPWSSSHDQEGAADSRQTAGLDCDETVDREEVEISKSPVVQMETGPVPSQTCDDSEDPGTHRARLGEMNTGSRVKESVSAEETESLLCSKCKNSLRPQGDTVAQKGGAAWVQGWLEKSTDADFSCQEESETDVFLASFGSSKSVSVQMSSSLPSVSQTTWRRGSAPPPNLRREIADATAATSSPGWDRKLSRGKSQKRSASLDTGRTWEEEEEEVGRWEAGRIARTRCCCLCDHRCSCCSWHTHRPTGEHASGGPLLLHQSASHSSPFTFSLDELEGMARCIQRFRGALEHMEEQLHEQETQVCSDFSELDREDAASVRALRAEVKREAELLERQLTELAQHCDTGLTSKMQRLLDEQSQLCMQLRLPSEACHFGPAHSRQAKPPGPVSATPGHLSGRCVATQCCLLPDLLLKDSLRHSVHSDGLE